MLGLRIAHVLTSLDIGGGERVALDLLSGQRALGFDVAVVSLAAPPEGPLGAEFRARGGEVVTVAKGRRFDVTLPARLAAWLHRTRVSLVHTHNQMPLIYGAPAGRLARARVVHTKHGANFDGSRRRWLRRASARLVDAYVAVSGVTAEQAQTDGEAAPPRLRVIENGIDLSRFSGGEGARTVARAELGLPRDAWVVGTVGRLVTDKNHALLVEAMAPLLSDTRRLVLVGSGPEADVLRARALALAGERARFVHFAGARTDAPRLYPAFDLFAMSSRSEGLPLVVLEAMASGLPVVSTAVGGIPAVVQDGQTGRLVPPGDAVALRSALASLAAAPALSLGWGRAGRERALARFSSERMVRDYLALYQQILERP